MPPARGVHPLRTETFRVSRLALAYLGVAQYLRAFWWFAAAIPLFGLIALVVGSGLLQVMGLMALLWPLSLPARAIFATSKAGKLLERGAWASLEGSTLFLHGEEDGAKLDLATVRRVERRRGFIVLSLARGDFLALPLDGIGPEFAARLEESVQ